MLVEFGVERDAWQIASLTPFGDFSERGLGPFGDFSERGLGTRGLRVRVRVRVRTSRLPVSITGMEYQA